MLLVILSEAKDLLSLALAKSRSFASLRMTTYILSMPFTGHDAR